MGVPLIFCGAIKLEAAKDKKPPSMGGFFFAKKGKG